MAQIGSLSVKLGLVTLEWDKATDKAKAQAQSLRTQFNDLGNGVKNLADKFKDFATLGGALGFGALVHEATALTDEVDDLSKSFGISIEEVLSFRSALVDAGGKAESTAKILSTMFAKIEDAQSGTDKTVAEFQKLGISLKELKEMQAGEAIKRIADGFDNLGNQFEKTKFIKEFFGKGGIGLSVDELSKSLKENAGQFAGTADNIRKVGQVSDQVKHNIENLTIAFTNLIAPFAGGGGVVSIKQFEGILKGIAAGTIALQIAKIAEAFIAVTAAVRAATGAAVLFNATAGGFSPVGLALKVASLGIGYLVYQKATSESSKRDMGVTAQGLEADDARDKAAEAAVIESLQKKKQAREEEAAALSKDAQQKQLAVTLATQQLNIERQKHAVQLNSETLGERATALANANIQRNEKVLAIEQKRKEDLVAQKNGTTELKDQINQLANIEIKKANEEYAAKTKLIEQNEELAAKKRQAQTAARDYADIAQSNQEMADYLANQSLVAEQIRKQYVDQKRNIELSKDRMQYEYQLMDVLPRERDYKLAIFDLEAEITEFKRQQKELGVSEDVYTERAQALRKVREEQIQLQEDTKNHQETFQYGWEQAYNSYIENTTNAANIAGQAFNSITGNMNSALDNFVRTGKLNFADLARSIIRDLTAIQLKSQATSIFKSYGSDIFGAVAGMFTGGISPGQSVTGIPSGMAMADGGSPPVGLATLVGERGPEMFVPRTAGSIIPNNQLSAMTSGGQTINYNGPYIEKLSAIDTQSSIQFLSKNKQTIWAANQSMARSVPTSR